MQAKLLIFLLTTVIYILGLFLYAESRTASSNRLKSELQTMEPVAMEMVGLAHSLDTIAAKSEEQLIAAALKAEPKPEPQVKANPVIVRTIQAFNDDIVRAEATQLAHLIEQTSKRYRVDPLLITALLSQESAFYEDAVSPVGAIGLGQLMPYTAADLGVNPHDPSQNLDGCVRYLAQNLDTWAHTADPVTLALASYNAGPGAVSSYGGVPPYEETQHYVEIINYRYRLLLSETLAHTGSGAGSYG